MPPLIIDVAKTDDRRDIVHRAVQALAEGQVVGFPTETVYGLAVSANHPDAVDRLAELKGRPDSAPFALAIKGIDDALDYAPSMSQVAQRLARRCWPGPLTLVVDATDKTSLANQLPESARKWVCPAGTVGLRVPDNQVIQDVLRMIAGPLALTSANRSGEPEAKTGAEVAAAADGAALVLDDGPAKIGQPSTVVSVADGTLKILREGAVSEGMLNQLSRYIVVLVCTGNTCRSPMAEGFMRRSLAKLLDCEDSEVEEKGVVVASAGLAASNGSPASRESVDIMHELGVDLNDHASQQLSDQWVQHADLILTMTAGHRQAIVGHWPGAAERTRILMADGADVADPIGGTIDRYRDCATQIEQGVENHAQEIVAQLTRAS